MNRCAFLLLAITPAYNWTS